MRPIITTTLPPDGLPKSQEGVAASSSTTTMISNAPGPAPPPPRSRVGEVGRVLLSSTMLGYDAAVTAARKHVIEKPQTAPLHDVPPAMSALPATATVESHTIRKKNKKKKKNNTLEAPVPLPMVGEQRAVEQLRRDVLLETERLFQLAGNRESALRVQLERLRAHNRSLEYDAWRTLATPQTASVLLAPDLAVSPSPAAAPRWVTPKDSEYDSDSASTSTTATTDDVLLKPSSATIYLRGRAQERILSQARDAISRAATLCQILADPAEPGSLERRDVLIRAFRAITMDVSAPERRREAS